MGGWSKHPFNPANNVTYTAEESGLPIQVRYAPRGEPTEHAFFRSSCTGQQRTGAAVSAGVHGQELSYSLTCSHVLYCMNNETGERVEWGDYWAKYVRRRAQAAGVEVYISDICAAGTSGRSPAMTCSATGRQTKPTAWPSRAVSTRSVSPDGGSVRLDVSEARGNLQVRWLNISRSAWQESQVLEGGGILELKTPGKGHWAVLVLAR